MTSCKTRDVAFHFRERELASLILLSEKKLNNTEQLSAPDHAACRTFWRQRTADCARHEPLAKHVMRSLVHCWNPAKCSSGRSQLPLKHAVLLEKLLSSPQWGSCLPKLFFLVCPLKYQWSLNLWLHCNLFCTEVYHSPPPRHGMVSRALEDRQKAPGSKHLHWTPVLPCIRCRNSDLL